MENHAVDGFGSRRSTVRAPEGVVATSQPLAATAGVDAMRQGGNAFDAAVTAAAVLNVVEPTSTGLGGDVFALYRTADGTVGAMRACGGAPAGATRDRVREAVAADAGAEDTVTMPLRGPHTVTVPGTARGWEATVERFGRRSLAAALAPAIRYATEGYPVTEVIASAWSAAEDLFETDRARAAYLIDGERAPATGERMRLPALGASLATIAEDGADALYEGAIGEAIAETVQAAGGYLTVDDLADFEVEWPAPVSATYDGVEVYELGPNNQGPIALEALNIAAALDVPDYDGVARLHREIEALKRAFRDGHHHITDPEYEAVPDLTDPAFARRRAATVGDRAGDPDVAHPDGGTGADADTVLISAADAAGNVVSYINSRYAGFGSGLVAGDTGIALQNRGASFSLAADHPNRLEPGKRPFHTLMPGLMAFDDEDWAAFGVMGGYMQPQGHFQVALNLIDRGHTPQQALDAPRWRYRENGRLAVEARYPTRLQNGLLRRGHDLAVHVPALFGGAQFARWTPTGLAAATEPRKDGTAAGF